MQPVSIRSFHQPPPPRLGVQGYVSPGFERVRDVFARNLERRRELGGACCAYYRGEKLVDLWGGIRNRATGDPWQRDTMVIIYSATKGLAAMAMALAQSRGLIDYEERVSTYWPEFAQNGKGGISVRTLLAHQAGLFALDVPVTRELITDLDRLADVLARQTPVWEPGTRQAYHGITLGFYENELIRRVDPRRRSIGQYFQDEIATPLGLDVYIRVPPWIPNAQLAVMARPGTWRMLTGFPVRFWVETLKRNSNIVRALRGSELAHDEANIYARNLEIPSGGAVGTARAIAHAYSAFACGGELGLRKETLDLLAAPAVSPARGFYDECMKAMGVQFSLGFMKSSREIRFGGPRSFGAPGAGGAMGFADPDRQIGWGYVTSQMGTSLTGDPREIAMRDAFYACLERKSDG